MYRAHDSTSCSVVRVCDTRNSCMRFSMWQTSSALTFAVGDHKPCSFAVNTTPRFQATSKVPAVERLGTRDVGFFPNEEAQEGGDRNGATVRELRELDRVELVPEDNRFLATMILSAQVEPNAGLWKTNFGPKRSSNG